MSISSITLPEAAFWLQLDHFQSFRSGLQRGVSPANLEHKNVGFRAPQGILPPKSPFRKLVLAFQ
jgi:hypothetical protein